jgi:hypothetical protein
MPKEEMHEQLDRLLDRAALAKFERTIPGCEVLHGFVVGRSPSLVLLHVVREFHLDGYSLIRFRDLEAIRCGQKEKFFQKMLRAEGVTDEVGVKGRVSLASMASALKGLARVERVVSVECETADEEQFYAGKISEVSGKTAAMRTFDPLGKWDRKLEEIAVSAITLLSWDTEYLRVFSKYLSRRVR